MYDPKQFLGKRVYNDSELELSRTIVMCKTLTESECYTIMEQAVAPCPEITMIIKGQKVRALLDMGSQVTLMNESYFLQNIQQLLLTGDKDHLNAHKLFNLKGVEDGCVPLTKYFSVDIQVGAGSFMILAFSLKRIIYLSLIPKVDQQELPPSWVAT